MQYFSTLKAKLIYIFTIDDAAHQGCVKIGEATLDEATNLTLAPNCKELNAAARKRIDQYTKTAGIDYKLRHTELTVSIRGGVLSTFNDKEIHNVLLRSGVKRHDFTSRNQGREWFECSVETAVKAIEAVKAGRSAIDSSEIIPMTEEISFRPEQTAAIEKTVRKFTSGGKIMLWNAKMRFGKTLSALQVIKECRFHRTIIITHRPVVDKGWFEDFGKIFGMLDGYRYGSREKGFKFEELEKAAKKNPDSHYVYFASIQDLRGAKMAGGKFDKNTAIFKADYDMLIVDEAHEGTQTVLGKEVIKLLSKENTHVLNLSGTPFNLISDYGEDEIYTWDYVMEQKAKEEWDINHFGDPNPYAGLPRLNIFTFELGKVMSGFADAEDAAFNFKEFFRTWTGDPEKDHRQMPDGMEGKFIHEEHVRNFLDLIVKYDEESNYPFSTLEFRKAFRHTLWMVPGVKEARALSALLQQHTIFGQFQIVNVAGDGDEDVPDDDALTLVENAMGKNPEETMTITLSCGKLTTGVSVKPWTAVMYLSGSHNTDAKAYMQTIFRVQTPYTTDDGKRKENCYVFDFAPDRTLKVLADAAKVSHRARSTASESDRVRLGEFLNFCPVIGYNGTSMSKFNVENMLEQLKRAYISRVTRNGCDDPRLYNQEMLRKLDKDALERFKNLHKIIGSTKANHASTDVDMAKNGLTQEEYDEVERIEKKKKGRKEELTEEEKRRLEEAKEKRKNADAAMSILRGISIRLPLLMYGAELTSEEQDVTLENFADLIDQQSWEEFMPRGVTKELFKEFTVFYDPDMFRAVGRNYRDLVRAADELPPVQRVQAIARIFEYFRNPDKETVLTPWRVVNMHIGDCIGGWNYLDSEGEARLMEPKFIDHGEVTEKVFGDSDTRILEINSKTGLYPLYMTLSVFMSKCKRYRDSHMLATDIPVEKQNELWNEVLRDNIFVVCKTEMAKQITKRTLRGFGKAKVNARYFEDLLNKITNQPQLFTDKVTSGRQYWKNYEIEEKMKFNAIVGNPPYQINDGSGAAEDSAVPIYNKFVDIGRKIAPSHLSMIMPSKWMVGGRGLKTFRDSMIKDTSLKELYDYEDSSYCFPNQHIDGGICYFLWEKDYDGLVNNTFISNTGEKNKSLHSLNNKFFDYIIRDNRILSILEKVSEERSFSDLVSNVRPYGIRGYLFNEPERYPDSNLQSEPFDGCVKIYGVKGIKGGARRQVGYISPVIITSGEDSVGKHKLFFTTSYSTGAINPPEVIIAEPNEICTETFLIIGPFETKEEKMNCLSYIHTKFFKYLLYYGKGTMHVTKSVFGLIPLQDWSKSWSDAELYKKYNLTNEEIKRIEKLVKPTDGEALFNTDELINPKFANFDLLGHGVRVGDRIIYTPTGVELIVAEDNKVECEGETYTLAEFTAKHMPRNKRSKSGLCQGPKYFSYNGVSLYQMKESFLGGK